MNPRVSMSVAFTGLPSARLILGTFIFLLTITLLTDELAKSSQRNVILLPPSMYRISDSLFS